MEEIKKILKIKEAIGALNGEKKTIENQSSKNYNELKNILSLATSKEDKDKIRNDYFEKEKIMNDSIKAINEKQEIKEIEIAILKNNIIFTTNNEILKNSDALLNFYKNNVGEKTKEKINNFINEKIQNVLKCERVYTYFTQNAYNDSIYNYFSISIYLKEFLRIEYKFEIVESKEGNPINTYTNEPTYKLFSNNKYFNINVRNNIRYTEIKEISKNAKKIHKTKVETEKQCNKLIEKINALIDENNANASGELYDLLNIKKLYNY